MKDLIHQLTAILQQEPDTLTGLCNLLHDLRALSRAASDLDDDERVDALQKLIRQTEQTISEYAKKQDLRGKR